MRMKMGKKISPSSMFFTINMLIILMMISKGKGLSFPDYWWNVCSNTTMFANNSQYQTNLNTLFGYLSSNATNPNGYHQAISSTGNTTNDTIYGHFLCRGDVNISTCEHCVTTATTTDLPKTYCPNRKEATIWYAECLVRYSNSSFFNTMDDDTRLILNGHNVTGNLTHFMDLMKNMMNNDIAIRAPTGEPQKKFAAAVVNFTIFQTIYGMGQCTPDLMAVDCYSCLNDAFNRFLRIPGHRGGRSFTRSCVARYELFPVVDLSSLPPPPQPAPSPSNNTTSSGQNGDESSTKVIIAIVVPIIAVLAGLFVVVVCCTRYRKDRKTHLVAVPNVEDFTTLESLQYNLATLHSATNNFSDQNKLGEGGFGGVFKGILENGQEIAVKRLSKNSSSGQGDLEFKTEVVLVAKLRHKNLVKLLGFCVELNEKLLVYEFLPKSSLDRLLFDNPRWQVCLDWQTRFNIIVGIARGLLYLHEDSPLNVIHRDLKSSNILLDEHMNPKIADFGLAKLFGVDQTQGDTKRIIGTYGYMAPEYAITGHYSVKSDVYSFGVLVLEIVSGQRSRFFGGLQLEEALLHRAWRLWNEDQALDLVDTTLGNEFPREEVIKCIHIGLLCIQEDSTARPRMRAILGALDGQENNLPLPKPPNFFGTNVNNDGMQHNSGCVYTGTSTITELYPRD